jgi:hypothetical protein
MLGFPVVLAIGSCSRRAALDFEGQSDTEDCVAVAFHRLRALSRPSVHLPDTASLLLIHARRAP